MATISGPYYSVGPIGTFTLDSSSIQNFLDDVRSSLEFSRWKVVDHITGSGGTTGYRIKSAKPPKGERIQVLVYWDGSQVPIMGYPLVKFELSLLGDVFKTFIGCVSITANKRNRIICGPYQFFVFFDTDTSPNPFLNGIFDKNNASGGVPFMHTVETTFWGLGDSTTIAVADNSYRKSLVPAISRTYGFLFDGTLYNTNAAGIVVPQLLSLRGSELLLPTAFADDNYAALSPILVMGTTSLVRAYGLWDAFVHSQRRSTPQTTNIDFRDWEAFTLSTDVQNVGCLFLATKSYAQLQVGSYAH